MVFNLFSKVAIDLVFSIHQNTVYLCLTWVNTRVPDERTCEVKSDKQKKAQ